LSQLSNIFIEGEAGLRGIISATRNLSDMNLPEFKDAVNPNLDSLKKAIKTVSQISKVKPGSAHPPKGRWG